MPFPSPGDLPNPGIEPGSPAWQAESLPSEAPEKSGVAPPKGMGSQRSGILNWDDLRGLRMPAQAQLEDQRRRGPGPAP